MSTPAFETVSSIISPVDASKLSGRYETTLEVNGQAVPVLRSVRNAPVKEMVLRGSLTPKKVKPSSDDVDGLCDMFQTKAKVTPTKKKASSSKASKSSSTGRITRSATKKKPEGVDSVKENLGQALKKATPKTARFSEDAKKAAATPTRRSHRRRTRSMDSKGK